MTTLMKKCLRRLVLVVCALALAACGNKETKEALTRATMLEDQKQFQDANDVLMDALQKREEKIRADNPPPTDPTDSDALAKIVQQDPEMLKMERAQVVIYLYMERADLASAVYTDILAGHPGDSVVVDLLQDKEPLIRTGAVRILGLAGTPDTIPPLTSATKDADQDVRRAAVAALGTINDPGTVEPLLAALKDPYWFTRSEAAEALGQKGDVRAIGPLLDAVTDSEDLVESAAETALLRLAKAPGASGDPFFSRLNDPNPKIVMISATCLAEQKDKRCVPVLLKLTVSPDLTTRLQALKALGEAGDPSVIPVLRTTLQDNNVNVRGWSIIGLGNLKDQDSLPTLRAISADANQPQTIRDAATAAVNHITGQDDATSGP
jgi:HEAT repeat protein